MLAGPATEDQYNTLQAAIFPIACFKLEDVRFDFDSSLLLPDVRAEMPFLKTLIEDHTVKSSTPSGKDQAPPASIFGHADPVGDDDYNKSLSGRRAAALYAMLTRRPEIWEDIYSNTAKFTSTRATGDKWGLRAIQIMLNALPPDPSLQPPPEPLVVDGQTGPKTQAAVKRFQKSQGLSQDGDPGRATRKALFGAYMDYLCIDTAGNPYTLDPTAGFIGQNPPDSDGKADFQGCSEFNPVKLFSQADLQRYAATSDHTERDRENRINRRVMVLLFKPCAKVDTGKWPCPKAKEDTAGCRKRFWSDGDQRRANGPAERKYVDTHDTFACRFYDRLVNNSPCEKHDSVTVMAVTQVRFLSYRPIMYVRIPLNQQAVAVGSFIQPPAAEMQPVPQNYLSGPQERPPAGQPHWRQPIGAANPDFSWPGDYLRDGAGGSPPQLEAAFQLVSTGASTIPPQLTVRISASTTVGLSIPPVDVTFVNGVSAPTLFSIQGLPSTVKHLNGFSFVWQFETATETFPFNTKHTLFILDQTPRRSRFQELEQNGLAGRYLWEIFVWSCTWADGVTGQQNVLDAIWAKFSPVAAPPQGATGLTYWKNYTAPGFPTPQNLSAAIGSQDWTGNPKQSSGSCIVMDRIFLNTISLQGIQCAEVVVKSTPLNHTALGARSEFAQPPNAPFPETFFTRGATRYLTDGWYDTTTVGQGNLSAPPEWMNHWIANVMVGGIWKLYDASYGEGPFASTSPTAATDGGPSFLALPSYEPAAVRNFRGAIVSPSNSYPVQILSVAGVSNWPRLYGFVLFTN